MVFFFVGALLCASAGAARAAAPEEAATAVKKGNDRFRELISRKVPKGSDEERKLAQQLTADMRALFDIKDLSRRALIDHWDKLTPAQRDELVRAMQGLIERSYLKQLRSNLAYQVDYVGEEAKQDDVIVRTVIHAEANGRPVTTRVDYVVHPDGGSWRVFDVITDDVGMIRNYRSQFNRIIAKEGVDGLLAKMKKKMAEEGD